MSREHCFSRPHLTAVMKHLCLVSVFVLCCFYNKEPQCSVITQQKFMIFQFQRSEVQRGSWEVKIQVLTRLCFFPEHLGEDFFCPFQLPEIAPFLAGGSLPSSKPAMARWVLPKSHPFDSLSCPFLHLKDFCVDTEPAEQARITSHLKGSWLAALIPSITWILLFLSKYSWLIILYYFQMYHIAIQDFSRLYSIVVVLVFSRVWLFENLWTRALQAPLSMGFPRQEYWSGLPFLSPRKSPVPGIEPTSLASPALTGGFFTTAPPAWQLTIHSKTMTPLTSYDWLI